MKDHSKGALLSLLTSTATLSMAFIPLCGCDDSDAANICDLDTADLDGFIRTTGTLGINGTGDTTNKMVVTTVSHYVSAKADVRFRVATIPASDIANNAAVDESLYLVSG